MTSKDIHSFSLEDISLYVSDILSTLLLHGDIEHDASLSRNDIFNGGDNYSFNNALYSALSDLFPEVDYYNTTAAGLSMKRRFKESQEANPTNTNTEKEIFIRAREHALFLAAMGDVNTGIAPKKSVQHNPSTHRTIS